MEGESPVLKDGALSLQTSLSHPELPPRAPAHAERRFDSLCLARVLLGEVLLFRAGGDFFRVRLSRPIGGVRERYAGIALKCGVVGIEPCVVPIRKMLLANLFPCDFYVSGNLSPLISRLRRQLPPQGEAFLQESFRATRQGDKQKHLHTSSFLSCGDKLLAVFSP